MFIDLLTLVMINLVAGTVLLAYYLWKGIDEKDQRPYAAAFFVVGLLSLTTGLRLAFTWPCGIFQVYESKIYVSGKDNHFYIFDPWGKQLAAFPLEYDRTRVTGGWRSGSCRW